MSDIAGPLLQWLNANPHWAGLITFFISAAESVAIIGTIVPGTIMMTAVGTLAGAGIIPLLPTIIWAIMGAIVGDGISYWLGYYFKGRMHEIWPFRTHPQMLANGERFFKKHGGMSVFIGRFVGPVRALVPLVAGMFGVTPLRFTIANVLSAIGWAPVYMLPGIILGAASLELPPDIATHAVITLLLMGLFIILCIWMIKKSLYLIHNQVNEFLNHLWENLKYSRHFRAVTFVLKHQDPKQTHGQLIPAFYFLIALIFFLVLSINIALVGPQDILANKVFFHLFRSLRNPTLDHVMIGLTILAQQKLVFFFAGLLFCWLAYTQRWHTAFHVLALVVLSIISVTVTKHLVCSPRPWGILHSPADFSFPSGHSLLSGILFFGLALLIVKSSELKHKWPLFYFAGIMTILVGISRMYLGAHWFTDVVGGWLLAIVIMTAITLSYNRRIEIKKIKACSLILVSLTIFVPSFSFYYYLYHDQLQKNSQQIDWPTYTINMDAWWNHTSEHSPLFRLNRFGIEQEILNLQWVGKLKDISQILLKNGWEIPPDQNWISVLQRLTDVKSTEHLPLVSPLYLDKNPVLVLIKHYSGNKKIIVLRLWESNLIIDHDPKPLWVGSVDIVPRTYGWLFKRKNNNKMMLTTDMLFNKIPPHLTLKQIIVKSKKDKDRTIILIKPN